LIASGATGVIMEIAARPVAKGLKLDQDPSLRQLNLEEHLVMTKYYQVNSAT